MTLNLYVERRVETTFPSIFKLVELRVPSRIPSAFCPQKRHAVFGRFYRRISEFEVEDYETRIEIETPLKVSLFVSCSLGCLDPEMCPTCG